MPNKQKVAIEEKVEYVRAYLRGEITQGRISKAAGVSLASVQVWIKRYKAEGVDGFSNTTLRKWRVIQLF